MRCLTLVLLTLSTTAASAADDPPRSTDPRFAIELFAEQPQIRTPTGIDVDHRGRVWAIESNTHFRPENYDGHPTDRLLLLSDTDGDGRADEVKTFAGGFRFAMSVAGRPAWMEPVKSPGTNDEGPRTKDQATQLYLATRREIVLLEDTDGDDACDRRTTLVHLETKGDYPHNGLAGFAFDAHDWLYFGFGENLGEDYQIVGRDGASLSGGGEGGNIYRMRPDGTGLTYWATGFWNPHASCVDAFGRLFTVDNDPDSRPPCRLLHVVEGGDYGYRFRNGRKGLHPFTAWNGEIAGKLPMVAGTGEAPSGVVACEHDAFPEEYLGNLLVTSWGDHRIDRFRLTNKGASFESLAEPLIVGGEDFRPVGIALAPDGSLYCTDWVLRDYNLHGKGRVWRISCVDAKPSRDPGAESLLTEDRVNVLRQAAASRSLPVRRAAARRLAAVQRNAAVSLVRAENASERTRTECLYALSRLGPGDHHRVLKSYVPAQVGPFDAVQTAMSLYFDESPAPTALLRIMDSRAAQDPMFIYAGMRPLTPLLRALGNSQSEAVVRVLGRFAAAGDPFVFGELVRLLAATVPAGQLQAIVASETAMPDELRLAALLAARRIDERPPETVAAGLSRPEPILRRAAVQWAGEARLGEVRPQVEAVLQGDAMTTDLFLATLAALELLDGRSPQEFDKAPPSKYVLPLLASDKTPTAVKLQALRLVDPADPQLTLPMLTPLLESDEMFVRLEAVRTLQFSPRPEVIPVLIRMAQDAGSTPPLPSDDDPSSGQKLEGILVGFGDVKAEAMLGLGVVLQRDPQNVAARDALLQLARDGSLLSQWDAATSLRSVARSDTEVLAAIRHNEWFIHHGPIREAVVRQHENAEQIALIIGDWSKLNYGDLPDQGLRRPNSIDGWRTALLATETSDSSRGRRVFYHPNGPGCSRCHTVEGRGGRVGPDLSNIGRSTSREKLIESILEPGKEVAPQFTTWTMVKRDGVVHTGMIVHENEGRTVLGDAEGKTVELATIDIEQRTPQRASVMPDKLHERMTVQEFRDLLAYLESLGGTFAGN